MFISRKWKWPKVLMSLMALELAGSVAALALTGIASPNLYRTRMWQIGSDHGFNSSPNQILYAYANYRPIPNTPLVWSGFITEFNLVISVLCTFILLVKLVLFVMHLWLPLLAVIVNAGVTALWAFSIYGQAGPDNSDPKHPSKSAWYITKSCDFAKPSGNVKYCLQAKGTFAVSVFMCALFFINLLLSIWSMIPSSVEKANNNVDIDDMQVMKEGNSPVSDYSPYTPQNKVQMWESLPQTAGFNAPSNAQYFAPPPGGDNGKNKNKNYEVPYTPRTMAFQTLDRKLPLRQEQR